MKFTDFLNKKLSDLLNDRRIVVWYDFEKDFKVYASTINLSNCEVLLVEESVLQIRRRADELYRLMNESEDPLAAGSCLLIYIPLKRGVTEEEKMRDPFENYALAGTAFGDTEDEKIESLARQSMPQKAEEITRMFHEGRPDIGLLDGLEGAHRWPLLRGVFKTETPSEIIALALCDEGISEKIDKTSGCIRELLRFLDEAVGFRPTDDVGKWKTLRLKSAEYILFSEFILDLPDGPPESLNAIPRARIDARDVINSACNRMRMDADLREDYVILATNIENKLHLQAMMGEKFNPGKRDTFPLEERTLLAIAAENILKGEFLEAQEIVNGRKKSIWRQDPLRSPAWRAVERAITLLSTVAAISETLGKKEDLKVIVNAYVETRSELDRNQRLFENALASCSEEKALDALTDLCLRQWREVALRMQELFLSGVVKEGWPPEDVTRQTRIFDDKVGPALEQRERVAYFLVDSLRYEMGKDLCDTLAETGTATIDFAAAVLPTETEFGMAALMPGADGMIRLIEKNGSIVPALGTRLLPGSPDRMRLLSDTFGDRFQEMVMNDLPGSSKKITSKLKEVELLVVRTQDPDKIGENLGDQQARIYMSDVIGKIASAVRKVAESGFSRVVIAADHGHVMLPEIPPGDVVQSPKGSWLYQKRRCLLGSGFAVAEGTITFKAENVGIQGDVEEFCSPRGFKVFSAGKGYYHGGFSLQEAIVPIIVYQDDHVMPATAGKPEIEIHSRSEQFTGRVIGIKAIYQVNQPSFEASPISVRIEAYNGSGGDAEIVGEAADCEARDEKSHEVILQENVETPVPVLIKSDFDGPEIEIRVSDYQTRIVWAKRTLKNAMEF